MPDWTRALVVVGFAALVVFAFFGGLYRFGTEDSTTVAVWTGISSGVLWTAASVASINWPRATMLAGALNAMAGVCTTGAVTYAVSKPEAQLILQAVGLH